MVAERPNARARRQGSLPRALERARLTATHRRLEACLVAERPLDRAHPGPLVRPEPRPPAPLREANSTPPTLRLSGTRKMVEACAAKQFMLAFSRPRRQKKG